jgi:hypothetical protein
MNKTHPGVRVLGMVFLFISAGCSTGSEGSGGATISKDTFSGEWPFTVDEGVLNCEGAGAVTFTANGTTYAVNGTARGATSFPDVDPIWAKDPDRFAPRIYIGDVIQEGLKLCE